MTLNETLKLEAVRDRQESDGRISKTLCRRAYFGLVTLKNEPSARLYFEVVVIFVFFRVTLSDHR